jgi:hypothetical protein
MTVTSIAAPLEFEGNDSATTFATNWLVYYDDDVALYHVDNADVITRLTLGTDYTVSGLGNSGGATITYPVTGDPLPAGEFLRIFNNPVLSQRTLLVGVSRYDPAGIEESLNRIVRMIQALAARALLIEGGVTTTDVVFPDPEAEQLLGWSATPPLVLTNYSPSEVVAGGGGGGGGGFDITALPVLTGVPADDDLLHVYDTSAGASRKAAAVNVVGAVLGDAKYALSSAQPLTANTEATAAFGAIVHNYLERGTYSIGTWTFTADEAGRFWVHAALAVTNLGAGEVFTVTIQRNNSGFVAKSVDKNESDSTARTGYANVGTIVVLAANDTLRVRVTCTGSRNLDATSGASGFSIMEI